MLAFAESSIQLVPDGTLLFHLVLIIAMVVLVNLTLLKPINRVLEERERRTSGKLGEAASISANTKEKLRSWEQRLREARNEAYRLAESERASALRERELRVSEMKAELSAVVAAEKAAIQSQGREAQASLEIEARRLGKLIGEQILGRSVTS